VTPPADALIGKVAPSAPMPLWGTARVSTAAPFTERIRTSWWRSTAVISVGLGLAVILLGMMLWPGGSRPATSASEPAHTGKASAPAPAVVAASTPSAPTSPLPVIAKAPVLTEKAAPVVAKPAAQPSTPAVVGATRVELEASEPSWISIRNSDGTTLARLIEPGNAQSVDIREPAILRAGNAGGLTIHANGKSVGPLGPHGSIREVEFKDGAFKMVPVK
jgi:cytoskeletal protein RodZ